MGGTFGAQTCTTVLQQGVIWSPTSFFLVKHSIYSQYKKHTTIATTHSTHTVPTHIHYPQFTSDSTLTTTMSKPIADHQTLYRPAVIIVMKRRNFECQVLSTLCAYFARNIRPRICNLSRGHFLRVFITHLRPRHRLCHHLSSRLPSFPCTSTRGIYS
jgi:hypothetical protein